LLLIYCGPDGTKDFSVALVGCGGAKQERFP
jgi:hypothetical protein